MDKHRQNSGFTLIEMLLVFLILSVALFLFPIMHARREMMGLRMDLLQKQLLLAQAKAMREGKKISVVLDGTMLQYDGYRYDLGMRCEGKVVFHPNGNVDRARTIPCHMEHGGKELIIQLGSGRMYVR